MVKHLIILIVLATCFMLNGRGHVVMADFAPGCPYPDGKYYQANTVPRYEANTGRLGLISWATGKVVQPYINSPNTTSGAIALPPTFT